MPAQGRHGPALRLRGQARPPPAHPRSPTTPGHSERIPVCVCYLPLAERTCGATLPSGRPVAADDPHPPHLLGCRACVPCLALMGGYVVSPLLRNMIPQSFPPAPANPVCSAEAHGEAHTSGLHSTDMPLSCTCAARQCRPSHAACPAAPHSAAPLRHRRLSVLTRCCPAVLSCPPSHPFTSCASHLCDYACR